MVAEKLISDHGNRNSLQEQFDDTEEEEDTLSLCDLPIYGTSDPETDDDHRVSKEARPVSADHDVFEFSYCEDTGFGSSQSFQPEENIVFCGKVIRYKQPVIGSERPRKQKGRVSRWWGSLLFRWGVSSSKRSPLDKYGSLPNSRWYLFVFGPGRFPIEMEMRDIKMRQSRRLKPTSPMFVADANGASSKKIIRTNRHGGAKASRIGCMPLL